MYHGPRFLFSPDAAPGTAAPPADAPATPAPAPPAASPAVTPATPSPAPAPAPGVDPNMSFDVMGTDGVERSATLQQMADAYSSLQTSPQFSADQLAKFQTIEKAMEGDAEAQRKLIEQNTPAAAASDAADPASAALVAANEQIKQLQDSIAPIQQQYDQIADARGQTQFGQIIESCKAQMPFTAQHPQGAAYAFEKYKQARVAAKAQGIDLSSHPRHQQVISAIFQNTEAELAAHAKAFSDFKPPAPVVPQAAPITATDDQGRPVSTQFPPGTQMLNGVPVDEYGRPVTIPNVPVDGGTIPSTGVGQAGSAAPGAEGQLASLDKPFTADELLKNMQARNAEQTT